MNTTVTLEQLSGDEDRVRLAKLIMKYTNCTLDDARGAIDSLVAGGRATLVFRNRTSLGAFLQEVAEIRVGCDAEPRGSV